MQRRPVATHEQPEKLHAGLQAARVVTPVAAQATPQEEPVGAGVVGTLRRIGQSFMPSRAPRPAVAQTGLPHGVTEAIVYVRDVRVDTRNGTPEIYFCPTKDYLFDGRTLQGADHGSYPPVNRTNVSLGCKLPADGLHTARMRVGVNGAVNTHIEAFDVEVPEELVCT